MKSEVAGQILTQGAVIDYGSRFTSFGDDTAGGEFSSQTKYKKVEETSYNGDGTVHRTETLYFDNAAGATFNQLLKGTVVAHGTTTVYGANWTIVSETTDLSAAGATATVLTDLPTGFVSAVFVDGSGNAITDVKQTTETYPSGGSLTTYYNGGDSSILGYSENMGSGGAAGTVGTSTNIVYFKPGTPTFVEIGSSRSDEFGSRSEFDQTLTDDSSGTITGTNGADYIKQTGSETFTQAGVTTQTRVWEYHFSVDANGLKNQFLVVRKR